MGEMLRCGSKSSLQPRQAMSGGEQSRLLEQRAERWLEAAKPSGQALSAFVRAVNQMAAAERAGGRDQHGEMHSGMPDALPAAFREQESTPH